jgi:hypothetical protein
MACLIPIQPLDLVSGRIDLEYISGVPSTTYLRRLESYVISSVRNVQVLSLVLPTTISFGYGLKEILGVSRLASRVASDCRGACGEHDVSTRDVAGLHAVLRQLEDQATKPESLLGRQDDSRKEDLSMSSRDTARSFQYSTISSRNTMH